MSLTIAIPHERRTDERRVALVPRLAERLVARGAFIRVEAGAARSAGHYDSAWELPGVEVIDGFAPLVAGADLIVKVAPPTLDEVRQLPVGSTLLSLISAFQHLEVVEALRERGITTLAMDLVPRLTRARSMNAVASQATVAGYKAALLAAELSSRLFPMLTTAAGTVQPARVVVIGGGVAGLQAIATARRLGARVEAYDIRRAARERIESLGARMIDTGVVAEGPDGLARPLRREEKTRQNEVLGERLSGAHAVICAASIPGRPAPRIVSRELVERMLPDTVLVDLAASTGGNCALTRPGEQVWHRDVLVVGPLNLPSHGAVHASQLYAGNVVNFLERVLIDGSLVLDPGDVIVSRMMLTREGAVHHLPTAGLLGRPSVPFGEVDHAPIEPRRRRARPAQAAIADDSDGWLDEQRDAATDNDEVSGAVEAAARTEPLNAAGPVPPTRKPGAGGAPRSRRADVGSASDADPVAPGSNDDNAVGMPDTEGTARLADAREALPVDNPASARVPAPTEGIATEAAGEPPVALPVDSADKAATVPGSGMMMDDLTLIDGIGPALQGRLRDFGYLRFADLSVLDTARIERLTLQLELDDEVERGDWVGQARRLLAERQATAITDADAGRHGGPKTGTDSEASQ